MTSYVVLLPGDEAAWTSVPEQETYARHGEFAKLLAERGHTITGGAGLTPSKEARVRRTDGDGEQPVTQGPYAESVEQLGGFFVVEAASAVSVLEAARVLPATWSIEARLVEGTVEGSSR